MNLHNWIGRVWDWFLRIAHQRVTVGELLAKGESVRVGNMVVKLDKPYLIAGPLKLRDWESLDAMNAHKEKGK